MNKFKSTLAEILTVTMLAELLAITVLFGCGAVKAASMMDDFAPTAVVEVCTNVNR